MDGLNCKADISLKDVQLTYLICSEHNVLVSTSGLNTHHAYVV